MSKIIVSFSGKSRVTFVEHEGEISLFHDEMDLVPGGMPMEAKIVVNAARRIYLDLTPDAMSIKYDSNGWFEIRIADNDDIPLFELLFHESEVTDIYSLFEMGVGARRYIRSGFDKRSIDIMATIINESFN